MVELIDKLTKLKEDEKEIKDEINNISAKIQENLIGILEDKNIKATEKYGSHNNSIMVTHTQKVEILNYQALEKIFGEQFLQEKVEKKEEIKYEINKRFKEALIIFIAEDYEKDIKLEEFIKNEFKEVEGKAITIILKKLKGEYKKDKELLSKYIGREDLDIELYFINKIKNYEKVGAFFDTEDKELKEKIRNYIQLDENIKLTIKYKVGE